jgi:hypothetical protein
LNLPANIPLNSVAMRQMRVEEQPKKMASDMEVCMKQRGVTEFLHAEKIAYKDIYQRLLNVYGDQTVDISTVRQWVACFCSADRNIKDKRQATSRTTMHSCHTTK